MSGRNNVVEKVVIMNARRALYGLSIVLLSFMLQSPVFADKGVFNDSVNPDEIQINEESIVSFTAEIGAEDLYISSVAVYETTAEGRPIRRIGIMHDDGLNGDERIADTIFTLQTSVNMLEEGKQYYVITAAYRRDRQRYMSQILQIQAYPPLVSGASEEVVSITNEIKDQFLSNVEVMGFEAASDLALAQAQNDPRVSSAILRGITLSIITENGVRGVVTLSDPSTPSDGPGNSTPIQLPENYRSPGNDKVVIFAPGYDDASRQNQIADSALSTFNNAEYMSFNPDPLSITKNVSASLELVKTWGNYGAVIIHTHGNVWANPVSNDDEVILRSGTLVSNANDVTYKFDLQAGRLGVSNSGKYIIYPSFVTKHAGSMQNTFFYLGACNSLENDTLWDALKAKGAKVALGWSETVERSFNTEKFNELTESMLPSSNADDPLSVSEAFDAIDDKVDGWCPFGICFGGDGATFTLRVDSEDWGNFVFAEGGIVNGDFETGDWTGWSHGGDYDFRIISGARKHGGAQSAALGRWDTAFHGADSTAEPFGYEWFYQDFVVPENVTYLKFYWWMETYDTAVWDWFDAYIKDTSGNTLVTILNKAGKPGTNYGPYWTTQIADGGDGWREVKVDISAYRGQEIRIYFDQRLDGFGDQQRVYIDDVILE